MPVSVEPEQDWTVYAKNICQAHNTQEFFNLMIDKVKKLEDQVAELQGAIASGFSPEEEFTDEPDTQDTVSPKERSHIF